MQDFSKVQLDTERCHIEGLGFASSQEYFNFMLVNIETFSPTIPKKFTQIIFSEEFWAKAVQFAHEDFSKLKLVGFIARDKMTKNIIMTVNFGEFRPFPDNSCSVGFLCDKNYVGKGLVRECLEKTFSWIKSVLKVRRIYAYHLPDNKRSSKTLNSLGFEEIGLVRGYVQLDENWHDHVLTSLIL